MGRQSKLTPKQARFIDEYMIDLNATQAAIRAGYSKKTAKQVGSENLTKPDVAAEVSKRRMANSETAWLTQEKILADIEAIKADAMQKIPDKDGNLVMANHAAALKASELHGRHRGMFSDKLKIEGGITLQVITGVDD